MIVNFYSHFSFFNIRILVSAFIVIFIHWCHISLNSSLSSLFLFHSTKDTVHQIVHFTLPQPVQWPSRPAHRLSSNPSHSHPSTMLHDINPNRRHRSFHQWLELLQHFHNEHGHCNVKRNQPGFSMLAGWVHRMRQKRKKGALNEDEAEALDSLGFQWSHISSPLSIDDAIVLLRAFKKKHGHCNVPYTYRPNQRIATWAHNQRSQLARKLRHQSSSMTSERFDKLADVGLFDFSSRETLLSILNIPSNDPYKPNPFPAPFNYCTYPLACILLVMIRLLSQPNSISLFRVYPNH